MTRWIQETYGGGVNYIEIPLLTPDPAAVAAGWRAIAEANPGYAGCRVHEDPSGVVVSIHRGAGTADDVVRVLRAAGHDVALAWGAA